ncbi:aminomethyltransferase, mitochondrial [Trichomonascus vanleenenianus]|uniref:glycine decarboxylase subunit T n=1 Tax=Trichomonascus vanleenenianus TaxID=2268995 RepID=UPI003ECA44E2
MMNVARVQRSKVAGSALRRLYSTESEPLAKTVYHDFHIAHGGKMVPYAGFDMPVLYKGQTHIESHNWVRNKAGMFDVSHMFQHRFSGPGATKLLEKLTPGDLQGLQPFTSTLSVLLNEKGGIIDDTIVTKHGEDDFYVVTNAGCREKDLKFFEDAIANFGQGNVKRETINGGLVALQGPQAAEVLQKLTNYDLSTIKFGQSAFVDIVGGKYHVARGGYTGEDGFEVSITDDKAAIDFANKLMDFDGIVKPIGLAARDSLRLEAGMCLYGYELNEDISPVEAALTWVIGKRRRAEGDFNGADNILKQIAEKKGNLRCGIISEGPAARDGTEVYAPNDQSKPIGVITSGSLSPTLKKNISMAYLPRSFAKKDTDVQVKVRGKFRNAKVVKMPFVAPNYYK